VNATQRVEELLELRDELQAQLDAANKSLKDQEAKLKAAREEGVALQAQFAAADEAKAAAEKVCMHWVGVGGGHALACV
jgi:predicted  nucleic acid-binding Zn-ribbon protein